MASTYDETQNGWFFPNSGVYYPTQAEADAAEQSPLRGRGAGQAYTRAQNPTQNFDWSQTQNPTITDKATGRVIQQGSNPSGDFGFEQFVLPAMMGGIGLGAAGLGPLAGAGTTASDIPLWQQPTAGGVPDTGFGASVNAPGAGGGFTDSIMNNPYAGGLGGTGGVNLGALAPDTSLGVMTGAGTSGLGFGSGSLMGDAAASGLAGGAAEGGDIFSTISDFLKSPIGGTIGNAATSLFMGNRLGKLAGQQGNYSSLDQSQRQPYQANLSQLVNNPDKYLSTDPFATSLTAMYRDKVIPRNVAASGNPGQVIDEKGSQFVNALAGNYNTQMGNLSGIAGFGFPQSQYAGYGAGQIGVGAAQQQGNAIAGLGNMFGQNFGKIMQGQAGSDTPFGTKIG